MSYVSPQASKNPSGLTMKSQRAPKKIAEPKVKAIEQIDHISPYVKRNAKNIVGKRGQEYR